MQGHTYVYICTVRIIKGELVHMPIQFVLKMTNCNSLEIDIKFTLNNEEYLQGKSTVSLTKFCIYRPLS